MGVLVAAILLVLAGGAVVAEGTRWRASRRVRRLAPEPSAPGRDAVGVRVRGVARHWAARVRGDGGLDELSRLCDEIARSLRSGAATLGALSEAAAAVPGPVGSEVAALVARVEAGARFDVSLRTWAAGRGGGESLLVADALVLGHTLGGGSAEVVEGVAGALRERLDLRREARAQAGPARLSMALVAALPLVFLTIVGGADPRLLSFLTSSPLGLACLAAGVGLDAAAFLAAEVLTRRALP